MADMLLEAGRVAATGLNAQSTRLQIIAENIANADSTGTTKGSSPYQRKTVSFEAVLHAHDGQAQGVEVARIGHDKAPPIVKYEPGHPAADAAGFVKYPNVNPIVEMADMREANRSYEANLQVIRQSRELINQTIDLLRG